MTRVPRAMLKPAVSRGGGVSLTGRLDWRHSCSYMNAKLLPQQDIPTANACNLSRVGELCKRFSSMIYRRDGSQLCSIWPHTRRCIFSAAQILPSPSSRARAGATLKRQATFRPASRSITQRDSLWRRVFLDCFLLLNKLLNYYALKNVCVISGAGACRHTCRRSGWRSSPHMYMSSRPLYMLFVQLERVSSSAQGRGVEVKFQGFTVTSPVSNDVQQTDVAFGAGALGSDSRACVILWHGCSSHRCFRREPSLIVLISAPHFLKTSLCLLSLLSFCRVLVVFRPHRDPSQITGSILCFHSEPCEAPQSAITAPSQSRSFIIFAAQTSQCSF